MDKQIEAAKDLQQVAIRLANKWAGGVSLDFEQRASDDIHQALQAAIAAHEASAWRPIEEAPRDGTRVLLFTAPYGAGSGHWDVGYDGEGSWSCHFCLNKEAQPTHYMPLPTPPSNEGE